MARVKSPGTCVFCGQEFDKAGMSRHLTKCRVEHPAKQGKPRKTFHLRAEGAYLPEYWMDIEIPAGATLATLDSFLRDIWLECCGHLSAFEIEGQRYEVDTGGIDGMWADFFGPMKPPKTMNVRLDQVLRPGIKFSHEYDFGTTTHLALRVIGEQEGVVPRQGVKILARNHPPPIACEACDEPATSVCAQCIYEGRGWVCDEHAPDHECGEDMLLPAVNSPRVGMCGYTGTPY